MLPSTVSYRYVNKWVTFAASCYVQACSGLSYSFSIYAPYLKEHLDLSQTQLATVGFVINLGGYFAIISGSIYDSFEEYHRLGPRLVIWLGSLCCFCGYFGLYLMASGRAHGDFAQLLLFAACAGNSGTWLDTSALVTNVRNFPNERGFAVGILKSFLGLSASLYTSIYMVAFEPDVVSYLLMLALLPSTLTAVLALFVNQVPFVQAGEHASSSEWFSTEGRFLLGLLLVSALAFYQMAGALLSAHADVAPMSREVLAGGMLCLLALVPLLALRSGGLFAQPLAAEQQTAVRTGRGVNHAPLPPPTSDEEAVGSDAAIKNAASMRIRKAPRLLDADEESGANDSDDGGRGLVAPLLQPDADHPVHRPRPALSPLGAPEPPPASENLTVSQVLLRLDFWLLFLQFTVGVGTGLAYLNNLGQIVIALGGVKDGQVVMVSLFSVANAAGRLTMGYIPEHYLHARATPRSYFLVAIAALTTAVAAFLSVARLAQLYVASLLVGFAFGAHWSLIPAITSDMFGLKHFAANYTTLQIAPAVGSFFLATRLAGYVYDKHAGGHDARHACIGPDCFHDTFMILALLAAAATLCSLLVAARTKQLYARIHAQMKEAARASEARAAAGPGPAAVSVD